MSNRSSKFQIRSGFILLLLLLGGLMWLSLESISGNSGYIEKIVLEHKEGRDVFMMRDAVQKRSLFLYRMLAVDDEFDLDEIHMQYREQASIFLSARNSLITRLDELEQPVWEKIKNDVSKGGAVQGETVNLILSGQRNEANKILLTKVMPVQDNVLRGMTQMLNLQNTKNANNLKAATNQNINSYIATLILGGLALIAGLIVMYYVLRHHSKTEELLIKQEELATQANQAKSTFLANMSHELRTPLTAIIGYSEMLLEDAVDDGHDEYVPDLENITHAGKHLMGLINSVLDISKIEAGKMELNLEIVEIAPMIQELIATLGSLAGKAGNSMLVECPEDIGSMTTDKMKLKQILMNLLSNANKFTKNGQILLAIWRETHSNKQWINFSIADTGIGIEENTIAKLFDEFSQANPSTTRKYGGTGLGLAITLRFTEMMGGQVDVFSVPDIGSIFSVKLPEICAPKPPQNAETLHIDCSDGVSLQGGIL